MISFSLPKILSVCFLALVVLASGQTPAGHQLAAGKYRALMMVVRSDGTVWGWGENNYGQLGNGSTVSSASPIQVSGLAGVLAVGAGERHVAALKSDGTVWTWGGNIVGQLGNNSYAASLVPQQVAGIANATAIAVGHSFTVVLKSDGTVWSWGLNNLGQLGDNSTVSRKVPVQVGGLSGVTKIAAGFHHVLALKSDGTVWSWGNNANGSLGDNSTTARKVPVQVSGIADAVEVAAGNDASFAVRSDGSVLGWGSRALNGVGSTGNLLVPTSVPGLSGVASVHAGNLMAVAVKSDGTLWGWGRLGLRQPNIPFEDGDPTPIQITGVTGVVAAAVGVFGAVLATDDGTLFGWGSPWNTFPALSGGGPTPLIGLDEVAGATAAHFRSAAWRKDGTLWVWGAGDEIIYDHAVPGSQPIQVQGLSGVVDAALGGIHTLALKNDGTVWSWGTNWGGGLGDGSTDSRPTPLQIASLEDVVAIAAGWDFSVALKEDGTVRAWGEGSYGQIGNGVAEDAEIPQFVSLSGITAIASGYMHSLAVKNDGTVWAWGANWAGQLGDGSTTDTSEPFQIPGLTNIVKVACGYDHSLALKSDGTVWAWGANVLGQLGDNSVVDRLTPVQVSGLTGVVDIEASGEHSLAIKQNGSVLAWGCVEVPHMGQDPYGDRVSYSVPFVLPDYQGVRSVSLGNWHALALRADGTLQTAGNFANGTVGLGFPAFGNEEHPTVFPGLNLLHAAPEVAITNPPDGETVVLGQSRNILAAFTSTAGSTPGKLSLYHHGLLIEEASGSPLSVSFSPSSWGDFTLVAVGVNAAGSYSARSAPVVVHVPYDNEPDGLPDWWEVKYGLNPLSGADATADLDGDGVSNSNEFQAGSDPTDYYNGQVLNMSIVAGDGQRGLPNNWAPAPLTVLVKDAANVPLVNKPVRFTCPGGGGVSTSSGGAPAVELIAQTDSLGRASVYFRFPPVPNQDLQINCQASSAAVEFAAYSLDSQQMAMTINASYFVKSDGTVWRCSSTVEQVAGLADVIAISVAPRNEGLTTSSVLALKRDGTVLGFTANSFGNVTNPAAVFSGVPGVVAISAGYNHFLALKGDGTVWAYGKNSSGELGDNSTVDRATPVQVSGLTDVVSISAGISYSLALKSDGTVWAWGSNSSGQLGINSTAGMSLVPMQVFGLTQVRSLGVGYSHAFAITANGSLWAWGYNNAGQLGNNSVTLRRAPVLVSGVSGVVSVSGGKDHSIAATNDGRVWAWGLNGGYQFGSGSADPMMRLTPGEVPGLANCVAVRAYWNHCMAVDQNGNIYSWGDNAARLSGEGMPTGPAPSGSGITVFSSAALFVPGIQDVAAVSSGPDHNVALKKDGTVWVWGKNESGQLGTPSPDGRNNLIDRPSQIPGLTDAVAVSAGYGTTLVLKEDGTVVAFGFRESSLLAVPGLTGITSIVAGGQGGLLVKNDGTLWEWNFYQESVVQIEGPTGVVAAAIGGMFHYLALTSSGEVWSWGSNSSGQLGNGTFDDNLVPAPISGLSGITAIAAGWAHSSALKSDGTVWQWGTWYSLEYSYSEVPVPINGLTGPVQAIAAGNLETLALLRDGTVEMIGTTATPVLDHIIAIGKGHSHALAVREDGTVVTWGDSTYGQLGVGWSFYQQVPEQVPGLNLWHTTPSVAITAPASGTSLTIGASRTIEALFTPGEGALEKIDLYIHGIKLSESSSSPLGFVFQPKTWGTFSLSIAGLDELGAYSARSTPIAIQVPYDADADGMPDWWEVAKGLNPGTNDALTDSDGDGLTNQQEYAQGTSPLDYYNGAEPQLLLVSGDNQTGPRRTYLPAPLIVKVIDASAAPIAAVPIRFAATAGALLGRSQAPGAPLADEAIVETATTGEALIYCYTPGNAGPFTITATGLPPGATLSATFHASATNAPILPAAAPSGLVEHWIDYRTMEWTWEDNSDNETEFIIQRKSPTGEWVEIGRVGPNATSFRYTQPE